MNTYLCVVCGSLVGITDNKCDTCKEEQKIFSKKVSEWIISHLPNSKFDKWDARAVWDWKENFIERILSRTEDVHDAYREGWEDGFRAMEKKKKL